MPIKQHAIGVGTPVAAAGALIGGCTSGATATGSGQSDAYKISTSCTEFTTVGANTGAQLPPADPGDWVVIMADGSNDLTVYGQTGEQINAVAANSGYTHTSKYCVFYVKMSSTKWRTNKSGTVSG